jgi:membrane protease subunit HflK
MAVSSKVALRFDHANFMTRFFGEGLQRQACGSELAAKSLRQKHEEVMAWNQPKQDDDKPGEQTPDPWGNKQRNSNNRRPDREPPDMDDFLQKILQALKRLLTGAGDFRLVGMVLPALLAIVLASGFYQVAPGGCAVVYRLGVLHGIEASGLHWRIPLLDTLRLVSLGDVRELPLNISLVTADEGVASMALQVQYRVTDVRSYVSSMGDPEAALAHATEAALHRSLAGRSLGQLTGPDHGGAVSLLPALQADMDRWRAGITVVGLKLGEVAVPPEVKAAYADVAAASQERAARKSQAEADAARVESEARTAVAQMMAAASAYQREAVDHAQADADRFGPLLAEYRKNPALVRNQLYMDTMEAVLGKVNVVAVADRGINPNIYLPAAAQAATPAASGAISGKLGGKP